MQQLPSLAISWTLIQVSRLRFSLSASADSTRNMASRVPSSRHLANRAYTDCQGPYGSDNSRHCAPLRVIQSIPLNISDHLSVAGPVSLPFGAEAPLSRAPIVFLSIYTVSCLYFRTYFRFVQYLFFRQGLKTNCNSLRTMESV